MAAKARRAREVFRFMRINSPAYVRIFHSDLSTFRNELVRTCVGLAVGAVAAPFANFSQLLQRDLEAIERAEP
jgi:hypothetical protein